jgi:hypothetical protein
MTIQLSDGQQAVIDQFPHFLMDEECTEMTIKGFAGSGKTFLVNYLAEINDDIQRFANVLSGETKRRKLYFTATTNKAANVLGSMLNTEAMTIHSLLSLRVQNYRGKTKLVPNDRGQRYNLSHSIIFVDEASMINRQLLTAIRKAQKEWEDCKIVYIGDPYQLPPVMEDITPVFDENEHTVRLTEIQRQVQSNPIIQLSAQFRDCLDDHTLSWPKIQGDDEHIITYDEKHDFFDAIREKFTEGELKPDQYRILAWSNQRVREYNNWIRQLRKLPPQFAPKEWVTTNKPLLGVNDKVLGQTDSFQQIQEIHPDMEDGIKGHAIRLIGLGPAFFQPWDWKEANALAQQYKKDALKTRNWQPFYQIIQHWVDLRPPYASTVHKSQGSTYGEVFVDLNNIGKNNNWREVARLVYVAITRTSHRVHLYGQLKERYNRKPIEDLMEPFKDVKCLATY